jgi:hypothetical protein
MHTPCPPTRAPPHRQLVANLHEVNACSLCVYFTAAHSVKLARDQLSAYVDSTAVVCSTKPQAVITASILVVIQFRSHFPVCCIVFSCRLLQQNRPCEFKP